MNVVLTRAGMEARFDGEWVLIANPETDGNLEVLRGRVVSHSQDPEAVYQKAIDQHIRHWTLLYFGSIPERDQSRVALLNRREASGATD